MALARATGLAVALDSDAYLSVRAEAAGYVPAASRVFLEPLSSDDWEILEANAEHLEGQMLTQVIFFLFSASADDSVLHTYEQVIALEGKRRERERETWQRRQNLSMHTAER